MRNTRILALLLLLALLLCACGKAPAAPTAETTVPVSTELNDLSLGECYESTAVDNVYDMGLQDVIGGYTIDRGVMRDGYLLLSLRKATETGPDTTEVEKRACLIHIGSGTVLANVPQDSHFSDFFPLEDGWSIRWEDDRHVLMDAKLQECASPALPGGQYLGDLNGEAWFFLGGKILSVDLSDGHQKEFSAGDTVAGDSLICAADGTIFFGMTDSAYSPAIYGLTPDTGAFTKVTGLRGIALPVGNKVLYNSNSAWYYTTPSATDITLSFPKQNADEQAWRCAGDRMVSTLLIYHDLGETSFSYDQEFRLYDLTNGGLCGTLSTVQFPEFQEIQPLDYDLSGYVILSAVSQDGTSHLLLWDTAALTAQPDPQFSSIQGFADENERLAKQLGDQCGIQIYVDELGMQYFLSSYRLTPCQDEFLLHEALVSLESCLREYPAGFFTDLLGTGNTGIEKKQGLRIFLSDRLLGDSVSGLNAAAGLSDQYGNYLCIALDVNDHYSFRQTLAHEMMHTMEYRLVEFASEKSLDPESYWQNTLNSPQFPYFYSYRDGSGIPVTESTEFNLENGGEEWFIDVYARTFPIEDRARVFENLYTDQRYALEPQPITEKAKFLCALIRAAFPSVGSTTEPMCWEAYTGIVDLQQYLPLLQ